MNDDVVIVRVGDRLMIRGPEGDDLWVRRDATGDFVLRQDEDLIIVSPEVGEALLAAMDLMLGEDEEEEVFESEDEIEFDTDEVYDIEDEDFVGDEEDELEWMRDAYEAGEIALTQDEIEMLYE